MIVSINQPAYLPWLGYFDRIHKSDVHVVLDHVQFEKNSMTNRNRIRTKSGSQMLTVPVRSAGKFGDLSISNIEIADNQGKWTRKHWQAIMQNYSRAKYFNDHRDSFEDIYNETWEHLNPLLRHATTYLISQLGIKTKLMYSSGMNISGKKNELVLNICKELGATTYISGPLGRDYLDPAAFVSAGIELVYHDYRHPTYTQAHGGFEPRMSAVDLLLNHGSESLEILISPDSLSRA